MAGTTISVEGVLTKSPTPVLPSFGGETKRESLIDLHQLISEIAASVESNLGRGQHGHFALTMSAEKYMEHTGYVFVPPHNPVDYPPNMGTAQEQALGTKSF